MTNDLDEVTARLTGCLRVVTNTVPDDPPPWDGDRRPIPPPPRHRSLRSGRRALLITGAATAGIAAVLLWPARGRPGRRPSRPH